MEQNRQYKIICTDTISKLTKLMNEKGIKREDIISLVYNEQYILVYFA